MKKRNEEGLRGCGREQDVRAGGAGGRVEGRIHPCHPEMFLFTMFTGSDVLTGV